MRETTKIVSQREALHKYQNAKHLGDGRCEVIVRYRDDGSEDPSCWNMQYRAKREKKDTPKTKKSKSSKSNTKGDSMCVKILFTIIPLLPIFWIVKAVLGVVLWPLRAIFCSNCDYPTPSYNFTKW